MKKIFFALKKGLALPLTFAMRALEDIDMDELTRAVDRRTARAEAAVLKDYFAQHGIEGEEAERAAEDYQSKRREAAADTERLRKRAEDAEKAAQQSRISAEALVQLARLGVPESCEQDMLLLVSAQLEKSEDKSSDAVKAAVESVLARVPSLGGAMSSGSRGGFPRRNDGASVWQSQLDRARALGDNAAAVGIITAAAEKGVALR